MRPLVKQTAITAMKAFIPCERCGGTGVIPDSHRIGMNLRLIRKNERIGLRELARRLGVSAGNLHDLEHGRRSLSDEFIEQYQTAVASFHK